MSTIEQPKERVAKTASDPAANSLKSDNRLWRSWALSLAAVLAFLATWMLVTELGWVAPVFLPSPRAVVSEAAKLVISGELWSAILISSQRVFLGFALAALVAIPLGILVGVWWPARAIVGPFISLLRPLPSITWIPLTMLWLGIGESQKVAIVFMGSWLYILLATVEATKQVDPLLVRAARNLGAGRSRHHARGHSPGITARDHSRAEDHTRHCLVVRAVGGNGGGAERPGRASSGRPRTGAISRSCLSA